MEVVSFSKTLYYNCFSSPRRVEIDVVLDCAKMVAVIDHILLRELRVCQEYFPKKKQGC